MAKKLKVPAPVEKNTKIPRATRFKPDPLAVAYMSLKNTSLNPVVGLILNESFTGCAILVSTEDRFNLNQKVFVKVGNLHAMAAEIMWSTQLDENIFKLGLKYLE